MMRLPSNVACRMSWLVIALFVVAVPFLAPMPAEGQAEPGPRPETLPFFHDADGIFGDGEMGTLQRDAQLLQSTGIPTLVYVRAVPPAEAAHGASQAYADQLRRDWQVASEAGADDGLVLLFSWVPQNPLASSTVFSYGSHTFEGTGLTPEAIQQSIDTSVRSLVEQERPFEAVVYLMRETRYTGIYAPPPPQPVEGAAKTLNAILRWIGPALAVATAVALTVLTTTFWRGKPTHRRVWTVVGIVLASAAALWSLSIPSQSGVGVASALLMVAGMALAAWIWSRPGFERHGSRHVRRRAVPSTFTLMRKRHQARTMLARDAGGRR